MTVKGKINEIPAETCQQLSSVVFPNLLSNSPSQIVAEKHTQIH